MSVIDKNFLNLVKKYGPDEVTYDKYDGVHYWKNGEEYYPNKDLIQQHKDQIFGVVHMMCCNGATEEEMLTMIHYMDEITIVENMDLDLVEYCMDNPFLMDMYNKYRFDKK